VDIYHNALLYLHQDHSCERTDHGGRQPRGSGRVPLPLENWHAEAAAAVPQGAGLSEAFSYDLRTFIEVETPWSVVGETESPIEGEKGNVEFFPHVR